MKIDTTSRLNIILTNCVLRMFCKLRNRIPYLIIISCFLFLFYSAINIDQPLPGYSGGFGEPTCLYCHFDAPVNALEGSLSILGIPMEYVHDSTYIFTIDLTHPELKRGGFQLAVRYATGNLSGKQSGFMEPIDERVAIDTEYDIQYARHTVEGTVPSSPETSQWIIEWQSPFAGSDPVVFHLVGNASNDDNSEFGDFLYQTETVSTFR